MLSAIYEGMTVYDATGDEVGEVEHVYFGAESDTTGVEQATVSPPPQSEPNIFAEALIDVFDPDEEIPEEIAGELWRKGFIRVDGAGLFAADRYVTADKIARVTDDEVHLLVKRDELIDTSEV